jgi:2-oxoglutarate ferredoxin oxidoreductase subunit beta
MEMALTAGGSFVAQGFSTNVKELTSLIEEAVRHEGFSFLNVFSPCVTYNKINTYDWFKENLTSLNDIEGYDPSNRMQAMQVLMEHNGFVTGLIYQDKNRPSFQELAHGYSEEPLAHTDLNLGEDTFDELTAEFM